MPKVSLSFLLVFFAIPKLPEVLETHVHKKFLSLTQPRMLRIKVFWSDREIKMPWNVLFGMNRESEMPQKSKNVKKQPRKNAAKFSYRENFLH